jgi:hypothetical protein
MDFGNGRACIDHGGKREQGEDGADHGEPPNASPVRLITPLEAPVMRAVPFKGLLMLFSFVGDRSQVGHHSGPAPG